MGVELVVSNGITMPLALVACIGLVWLGCRQCAASHVRALRSDDDLSLRQRWESWRRDTRVAYSKLPI